MRSSSSVHMTSGRARALRLQSRAWSPDVVPDPVLSADGRRLFYTLTTPRGPAAVWVYDRQAKQTRCLTSTPGAVPPEPIGRAGTGGD